jgi:hypothetical protein
VRHQVGVGDQHAGRVAVRLEHADRLARLDEQRLVVVELLQYFDDLVEALPVAGGAGNAAVYDQFVGLFRDLGVEVVHQHAQRRLGQPRLGAEPGASRSAYAARRVDARVAGARGRKIIHRRIPDF